MPEKHRICFISRNYKRTVCAGGIARTTIEKVLSDMGAVSIGLPQTRHRNSIRHGLRGLASTLVGLARLRRNDVLVVQYPVKIYLPLIQWVARLKGAKTIALLIDLSAFRKKTLTPDEEIRRLNRFDVVLTHNGGMRRWLAAHGLTSHMVDYEIMDYLYGQAQPRKAPADGRYSMFYVGNLTREANGFLYELAAMMPDNDIYLYGNDYDRELTARLPNIHPMGFVQDVDIINDHRGDFGISWYGTAVDAGIGMYGEYMNVNNPYKVGLYLRCNAPVIAWSKAGRAEVIERDGLGITVDTLAELPDRFARLTPADYQAMLGRVEQVGDRLASGWYLRDALRRALALL